MPRFIAIVAALCVTAASFAATPARTASADSIYDSKVEQNISNLTGAQRAKVRQIVSQGRREVTSILRKHGIDPNSRPVFQKLQAASDDLISYRRKQRAAMAEVLNEDQLDQYDALIEATSTRIRRAAQ